MRNINVVENSELISIGNFMGHMKDVIPSLLCFHMLFL